MWVRLVSLWWLQFALLQIPSLLLQFDQSAIGLSREYLVKGFNETLVSSYYDYMVDMAVLFGADKDVAKSELRESLDFEIALANVSWLHAKLRKFT